ncbi:MAG: riboflavin biosynthesis protein RibF [Bacteroidota bacterium]|nr:riboflavin biosynthesis protein RibF [Bacteroidota bacterium]
MRIFRNFEDVKEIKNAVVTTGSFDGVHVGHYCIIQRLNRLAKEIDGESVLVTFFPHPRKVLFPDTAGKDLKLINSQREKIELLEKTGLNNLVIIDFTIKFSQISSEEFIREILVKKIHTKKVVIGFNHHFGHNRTGDFNYLYKLGKELSFEAEEIPEQDIHNEVVSSTKIRKAIQEGRIQKANAYLDHHYIITGEAKKLSTDDNLLQWYNINIEEECKLMPPEGIYAIFIYYKGKQHKGMVEISENDKLLKKCNHNKNTLLNLFDTNDNLNGKIITIYFASRIQSLLNKKTLNEKEKQYILSKNLIEELIY